MAHLAHAAEAAALRMDAMLIAKYFGGAGASSLAAAAVPAASLAAREVPAPHNNSVLAAGDLKNPAQPAARMPLSQAGTVRFLSMFGHKKPLDRIIPITAAAFSSGNEL